MSPDDLRSLETRVAALERWVRDGDARDRRVLSEVKSEYAALVDSLKRHTDISNQAQIQPVLVRLVQLEASIARVLASDSEDREIKERMRIALAEHTAAVAAEARVRQESRLAAEEREASLARAREHRAKVLSVVVPIVVAVLGLLGTAAASHFR